MKRIASILLIFMAMSFTTVMAQLPQAPSSMKGKIVTGGDFGLSFYGNSLYFNVSPQIGYRLTPSLEVGLRLGYNLNFHFDTGYGKYSIHHLFGGVYANYEVIKGLYLHVEDEEACRFSKYFSDDKMQWYNSLFAGAGYRQYVTEQSFVFISVLYNLSWKLGVNGEVNSPYASPLLVRAGYCIGF